VLILDGGSDHIVEHLIDPVLSGTYGSDLCDMSMAATFPLWYPLMHDTSSVMAVRTCPRSCFGPGLFCLLWLVCVALTWGDMSGGIPGDEQGNHGCV